MEVYINMYTFIAAGFPKLAELSVWVYAGWVASIKAEKISHNWRNGYILDVVYACIMLVFVYEKEKRIRHLLNTTAIKMLECFTI